MHSFIITLTYNGSPVIFRFASEEGLGNIYEVSAINNRSFPPFLVKKEQTGWKIFTDVPEEMKGLEKKLGVMIEAYMEGHRH